MKEFGESPECLISVRPGISQKDTDSNSEVYNGKFAFILTTILDAKHIIRTETHKELIYDDEYNYYHFYNNGKSEHLRINVVGSTDAMLDVYLSRDRQSRPPYKSPYIRKESRLGDVVLDLHPKDL